MARKIEDLREHLFAALDGLRDGSMDIERAKAVADVSRVIVDTAKVECEHMKLTASDGSGFIPGANEQPREPAKIPDLRQDAKVKLVRGAAQSGSR